MPSPSSSLATTRPDLAGSFMEFDLEMQRRGFIANRVLPVVEVQKSAGKFGKIPVKQLLANRDTKRAPGAGYSRGNFTFDPVSFATEEHGAEEPVDDREATLYNEYFDAEQVAAMRAFEAVLSNAEQRAAALLFNTTTWSSATTVTNEWDDVANATPITDVDTAVKVVYNASGIWPNALIINRKVFKNLVRVDQITNIIKYQGFQDARAGAITEAALAQALNLEMVIVAGTSKDSANEGQAASVAPIWSDEYAMVAKVATTSDIREPCVGRTFHWAEDGSEVGGTVETYRDEKVRSDVVRVRHDVDELVLYSGAAQLLDNITT